MKVFLYGPPGSGKSTTGRRLAERLGWPFLDLDREIEAQAGYSIPQLFADLGESGFRRAERQALERLTQQPGEAIVALGAGALLDPDSLSRARTAGKVICLTAEPEILLGRLASEEGERPLLVGGLEARLAGLLESRHDHYAAFSAQVRTDSLTPDEAALQAQVLAGCFRVEGMGAGYLALALAEPLEAVGSRLAGTSLGGPVAVVSDENVSRHYGKVVMDSLRQAGLDGRLIVLPAGEAQKNLGSLASLWGAFLDARLDRRSTVLALGGGVITDLAGFAAATYLRGIRWAAVPTSLLGMVDAGLGGKTGIDLEQGKNLAGAFHAPSLVLAYPHLLTTLPEAELRNGLAEVVKAGLIGDEQLFETCAQGWAAISSQPCNGDGWADIVRRSMGVKIRILGEDPYEGGRRAVLNLGHTVGHALEQASGYALRHGEAVAIGLAAEAWMGEALGITQPGLFLRIREVLAGLGLPVQPPAGLDVGTMRRLVRVDKKRQGGRVRLPLPAAVGQAVEGVEIEEEALWQLYSSYMDRI